MTSACFCLGNLTICVGSSTVLSDRNQLGKHLSWAFWIYLPHFCPLPPKISSLQKHCTVVRVKPHWLGSCQIWRQLGSFRKAFSKASRELWLSMKFWALGLILFVWKLRSGTPTDNLRFRNQRQLGEEPKAKVETRGRLEASLNSF